MCVCQELLTCITYYHKTLGILTVSCELVAIATATMSNPTASLMCHAGMLMSPANAVKLMSVSCSDSIVIYLYTEAAHTCLILTLTFLSVFFIILT